MVFTWALMFALSVGSKLITRKFTTNDHRSRRQNLLEIVVVGTEKQMKTHARKD
jgi:F-type H+-transporting ATPase subunit a